MTQHKKLTKETIYTTRIVCDKNAEKAIGELETIRKKQLGGRGIIYRQELTLKGDFDSISKTWEHGPGCKLTLTEII